MDEPIEEHRDNRLQRLVKVDGKLYWVPSRALTIRQPWVYFTLFVPDPYKKNVENRSRGFNGINFMGPVWVHAAEAMTTKDYVDARQKAIECGIPERHIPNFFESKLQVTGMNRGGIHGQVCIQAYYPPGRSISKWHFADHHGFVLAAPTVVPFVSCKGQQGFWCVPPPVLRDLVRGMLKAGVIQ